MTDTIKYSLGALFLILLLFLYNKNSQKTYSINGEPIFTGDNSDIYRILISEDDKNLELVKNDTTWRITQADSFIVKDNQIDKLFNRLLKVKQEMLITSKKEKWEKFGVDDSLGRHIQIFDKNDNESIHFIFGNSGQDYQHNYIRENKSNDVYRTNDNVYFLLNCNTTYWGNIPPDPNPEEQTEEDITN